MAQTYFGSALRSGSGTLTDTTDGGFVVLMQTSTVTTNADGTASSTSVVIPSGSQIVNIFIDQTQNEVVGGGTATAINATTDVIGGGRAALTFTAAQLAAMADVGSNTSVFLTVDPNGTISTTQGIYRFTVVYAQKG
jgi:hypothetical protein